MWLLKYDLSNDDKLAIECGRPLTKNIVNAAIDIMHSKYPNLDGLKSVSILPDFWGKIKQIVLLNDATADCIEWAR